LTDFFTISGNRPTLKNGSVPQTSCKNCIFHQNKVFSGFEKVAALKKEAWAAKFFSGNEKSASLKNSVSEPTGGRGPGRQAPHGHLRPGGRDWQRECRADRPGSMSLALAQPQLDASKRLMDEVVK
jgi:hypothetical protein